MEIYVPEYYSDFQCRAGRCRHTCCQGWEIDIDEASMIRFSSHPDIMEHIKDGSFILSPNSERCPFLNDDGLCSMIITHGEDYLCDICKDHPRFRNYYHDRIEMGIGLCCEAACELILKSEKPFRLVSQRPLSDSITMMKNRDIHINDRIEALSQLQIADSAARMRLYKSFECLDPSWDSLLDLYESAASSEDCAKCMPLYAEFIENNRIIFEQLAIYYLYRYPSLPAFAKEACIMIAALSRLMTEKGKEQETDVLSGAEPLSEADIICDIARRYSCEVEYSDVNISMIYEIFGGENDQGD